MSNKKKNNIYSIYILKKYDIIKMVMYMTKENIKKESKLHIAFLIIAFIAFIAYLTVELMHFKSFNNFLPQLFGSILILLFLICFIVISSKNKKQHSIVIIGSILIIIYSVINILITLNILNLPKDDYVPNFYNKIVLEVTDWKNKNNIKIIENYEYSDTILKDYIISQDVQAPTLTKDIKELVITISLGPDLDKEVIVPSFVGLKYEDVLKYIEENHLSNVKIEYQKSEKDPDTVISQSKSGTMKRNSEIVITFAKSSEELDEIEIIDFTGKTLLYAKSWLEKYGFKVETIEDYSDEIESGLVMNQSAKEETKNPNEDTITLTISKGKQILAPDIASMTIEEINKWAIENNVKIKYNEEYNDTLPLGDVIKTSTQQGDVIDSSKTVEITISKGKLEMIKLTTVNEFINWAEEENIDYQVNYENSDTVKKDEIIKCSHDTGSLIKNDDTVIVTVSKGKVISIPNFVGMEKSEIKSKCSSLNLSCNFKTGGYTESTKAGIAISQSKSAHTKVSEGSSLTITLSAGIQEKVNVPNFVGKSKSDITSQCNSIGIKCSFKYESKYSSTKKDICTKQSVTGKVNKGSSVTITLSKGPAKTHSVIVQGDWLTKGAEMSKKKLQEELPKACPNVKFVYSFTSVDSGIGLLSKKESQIQVGYNTCIEGETYRVVIQN